MSLDAFSKGLLDDADDAEDDGRFDNDDDEEAILEDKGQEGTLVLEWSNSQYLRQRADQDTTQ